MTTRRTALGAILGGVFTRSGPEILKAALANATTAETATLQVISEAIGVPVEMIEKWHRWASGNVTDDDIAYPRGPDHFRDLEALRSVSPMVRRLWCDEREIRAEKDKKIRDAIKALLDLQNGVTPKLPKRLGVFRDYG